MSEEPDDLIRDYTFDFTVDGQTVSADMYDDDLTLGETIKSAETHIKKLYDKAVVKRFQFAADEQQKMRQNLQELQCLQFYAKDNITGQVVSQLPEGQTPAMLKDAPVYYSKTKAGENLRGTDYGARNASSDAAQYLMDGDMSIYVGIDPTVAGGNDTLPDFVELNALCTRMQNMNTVAMTVAAVCLAVLALAFWCWRAWAAGAVPVRTACACCGWIIFPWNCTRRSSQLLFWDWVTYCSRACLPTCSTITATR